MTPLYFSEISVSIQKESIPRIVYQILNNTTLTFRNYLSILSVHKILKPYRIILYVPNEYKPRKLEYNAWLQKAADTIPYLEVERYSREFNASTGNGELQFLSTVLKPRGGVYVNLNTIMISEISYNTMQIGIANDAGVSFVGFAVINGHFNSTSFEKTTKEIGAIENMNITSCALPRAFKGHEQCSFIPDIIYPVSIMRDKSPFAAFVRRLCYGTSHVLEPQRSFPPIPKIVHYTWFGGGAMTFDMYLSFQSTLLFVKPTQIIIYVDSFDLGIYFEKMKKFNLVTVVYYGKPMTVFQKTFKQLPHISDYVRSEALLRHGGIYLDWDVFWLKPVDDLLALGYETIASYDNLLNTPDIDGFPDGINMGVVLARPGSRFIALWQDSFREYTGDHPTFHAVENVYKLYEEHPDLLYIEKRLQVICFRLRCHPFWQSNYHIYAIHNEFNFTKDAYTVHFTFPIPKEFKSKHALDEGKGFFAKMARHIFDGP